MSKNPFTAILLLSVLLCITLSASGKALFQLSDGTQNEETIITAVNTIQTEETETGSEDLISAANDISVPENDAGVYFQINKGDLLYFGRYEQDGNVDNEAEPIEWQVLEIDSENQAALLLSRYTLINMPYNQNPENTTWRRSTLRNWLNQSFYQTAFDENERSVIKTVEIHDQINRTDLPTSLQVSDTEDRVFLLSKEEISRYFPENSEDLICKSATGASSGETVFWWLRDFSAQTASAVNMDGFIYEYNNDSKFIQVRPALWMVLNGTAVLHEENNPSQGELLISDPSADNKVGETGLSSDEKPAAAETPQDPFTQEQDTSAPDPGIPGQEQDASAPNQDSSVVDQGISAPVQDSSGVDQGISAPDQDGSGLDQGISDPNQDSSGVDQGISDPDQDGSGVDQGISAPVQDGSGVDQGISTPVQDGSTGDQDISIVIRIPTDEPILVLEPTVLDTPVETPESQYTPELPVNTNIPPIPTMIPTVQPTKTPFLKKVTSNPAVLLGICVVIAAIGGSVFFFGHKSQRKSRKQGSGNSPEILPDLNTPHNSTVVIIKEGAYVIAGCKGQGKRDYQEDSLWFSENVEAGEPVCAVIADGMGGMENGAASSAKAIDAMRARVEHIQTNRDIPSKLWQICNAVNDEVYSMNTRQGMNGGSTLICTFISDNMLYWISIGDSRIYLYRDGILAALNEEHELESRMYKEMLDGEIDLSDIRETPDRELRKLTSNLGRSTLPLIDQNFIPYKLRKGDKLLLCSDGVSGTLSESDLLACLRDPNPDINCDAIVQMVEDKNKRGQDNYSAIVVYCATEDGK